jgi:hypothetical protein
MTETLDNISSAAQAGIQLAADIPFKIGGVEQVTGSCLFGNTFYAYGSMDGKEWTTIGEKTVAMKNSVYVGFAVDLFVNLRCP